MTSKYGTRTNSADSMVNSALEWVENSLVYAIPIMTEYSAFSRALLTAAVQLPDGGAPIEIRDDMVARSMQFLRESDILNISALITYPHFVRALLTEALQEAMPENPSATIIPLTDTLITA